MNADEIFERWWARSKLSETVFSVRAKQIAKQAHLAGSTTTKRAIINKMKELKFPGMGGAEAKRFVLSELESFSLELETRQEV